MSIGQAEVQEVQSARSRAESVVRVDEAAGALYQLGDKVAFQAVRQAAP